MKKKLVGVLGLGIFGRAVARQLVNLIKMSLPLT